MNKLPYEFLDEERTIRFGQFDLPSPWINYLSNGSMHAFVSQAGGGMTWWKSPMTFRISRYRFYNLPIDSPGYYIYLRMEDGTVWSPTFRPCSTPVDRRESKHAPGFSTFIAEKEGITACLTLFMAFDTDTLIWSLNLYNASGKDINIDVFAYVELSQYLAREENILGYYLKWNTRAVFEPKLNAITYAYTAWMHPTPKRSPMVYFGSDAEVESFCCDRDVFCGHYRDERDPAEVEKGRLSDRNLYGGEPCGALHTSVKMAAGTERELHYYLGVTPGALSNYQKCFEKTEETLSLLRSPGFAEAQLDKQKEWWKCHLSILQCEIPDTDAEREINLWNPVQCVQTARYSRSISSDASGIRGIGFRDTAQDMLAQAYRKPEWATEMLCYLASQQFEDGHPVHQSWPEENRPPQDIPRSDNHLWMVYLAYAIAAETGDVGFLDREIPFLGKDMVSPAGIATLWDHLIRAIEFSETHLGQHGLPLILFSDWNDHMGPYGRKGKGETIFVSEQFIYALQLLSELAERRGDVKSLDRFQSLIRDQKAALEKCAWDGNWFLRGFDDDGAPVGSHTAEHARCWINPQSWMVIADAAPREKMIHAMDCAEQELDTGLGLLLNAPGYPGWPSEESCMVNGLPAGYSENGGVFCQANCWAILAEAKLGRGSIAWKYYKDLLPHSIIQKIGVDKYHSESYAYCSTLLGKDNEQFGRGCVSQVTGTAAWMDIVATQYLLGIRPTLKGLLVDPSIPSDWDSYTVKRVFRGCNLTIRITNPNRVEHGVVSMTVDGTEVDVKEGAFIPDKLLAAGEEVDVKVVMGMG